MTKNIELIVHWGPDDQTSFFIDHWKRNERDLILWPQEGNGVPRLHIPLASIWYFELQPLSPPVVVSEEIQQRLELELIDDAFCDVFADRHTEPGQVALRKAIDRLHAWRAQYGMTYEPFEGGAA